MNVVPMENALATGGLLTREWHIDKLQVDKALPTPAYLQLRRALGDAIRAGALAPGTALPSERDLAAALHLSRMTVRRAFEELVLDTLVEQRQGSGTFVLPQRLEQTIDRVLGFTEEARSLGFRAGSKVLEALHTPADQGVADALSLSKGTPVLRITRLRTADGEPLALQTAHLSPRLESFPVAALRRSQSLYRTITRHYGIKPHRARQTVSARLPFKNECEELTIGKEVPLLALERTTFDAEDEPFEYVRSAYRSDKYGLALELRAP